MMNCPKILLSALAIAVLPFIGCSPGTNEELLFPGDKAYQEWVGKTVEYSFKAFDGRQVNLNQYRGKVVLLDFWATWCPPCMAKVPEIKSVYNKYHSKGFEIVGFSFDADAKALSSVLESHQMTWPQYFDGKGRNSPPGGEFGIRHFPSMWLLDKSGKVRFISAGANLEGKVNELLKESYDGETGTPPSNPISIAKNALNSAANFGSGGPTKVSARSTTTAADPNELRLSGLFAGQRLQQAMLKVGGKSISMEPGQRRKITAGDIEWVITCESVTSTNVTLKVSKNGSEQTMMLSPKE